MSVIPLIIVYNNIFCGIKNNKITILDQVNNNLYI